MTIRELRVRQKFGGCYGSDDHRHNIVYLESHGIASGVKLRPKYYLHDKNCNQVGFYVPDVQYYDSGKRKVVTVDKYEGDALAKHLRRHFEIQYKTKVEIWSDLAM